MIYLDEVQRDLASKIEAIFQDLDQTYDTTLVRAPMITTDFPEDRAVPSSFLKLEDKSKFLHAAYFYCAGVLLLDLPLEWGETKISAIEHSLGTQLQARLDARNETQHTYYTGVILKVNKSFLRDEKLTSITIEFEVRGVERSS